ncbi:hypothetical protein [Paraburkholderia bryophila]|uniref:Uncharacterized membrane protein (DUF2068 family) n=1 Tax=Paraburkholderia bryophila TaxID=420952 RepID=A0A7Z0B2G1_9BURK|nr:hypothetical protein [Paraburkholderia bryophila]NYH18996.1 uncharacterized membrane protein (DUF2068 family) [Paraburkholderia bryophila]
MSRQSFARLSRHALLAASLAGAVGFAHATQAAQATSDADLPVPHHVAVDTRSAHSAAIVQTARRYADLEDNLTLLKQLGAIKP